MKNYISKTVDAMKPSGIRAFFDLVLGMKDVISLGVGEPDFVTPWEIREAGITSLEQGFTSYTSNKGLLKLRLAIHNYLKSTFGISYSPENEILITVGVSEGVDLALRAIMNPGDKILVPMPSYVSYGPMTELAGGIPVYIDTRKDDFKLTAKNLERHIDSKTKGIIFNYPANPTGVSYTKKELEQIKKVLIKHKILCISDEIYCDLTYDFKHTAFPSLPGAKEYTLYLNGFSKSYRNDRMARRICVRPERYHRRDDKDPPVYDHVRAYHEPDGGVRRLAFGPAVRRRYEARIQAQAGVRGRPAE